MPLYLSPEIEPPPVPHEVCDWMVTPIAPGRVCLYTPSWGANFSVTFTPAALPQLRQVVQLLEAKQS